MNRRTDLRLPAIIALALGTAGVAWGADIPAVCALNGTRRVVDKLEAYVQSGVGFITTCRNNDCCVPSKYREILVLERNKNASVWARAVLFDQLNVGIPGKDINVTMVDSTGREIGIASGEYTLSNANVTTDSNGFSFLPIVVRFTHKAPTDT